MMATIPLDDTTAGRTYVCQFIRDSDGYIWDGVSAWVAPNTLTDAELKTAIELVTTTAVLNQSSTHIGYSLTVPAGVIVPCHVSLYLTSYTAGDSEDYGAEYTTKDGYALAATGLDAITVTEPSAKPTTFPGWIMWLVQRFRRSAKSTTAITVLTEAGATVTSQAITDDGAGAETLGPPT